MGKQLIFTLVFIGAIFSLKAQTYISLDKGSIEKETYDLINNQSPLSNYFTVYTVTPHETNKIVINKKLQKEIIKSSYIIDVVINTQKNKLVIYSKYKTDASAIKNVLYHLNFIIDDYEKSYAIKNKTK